MNSTTNETRETLENGAQQSKLDVRYDLIPPEVLERLAIVFAEGIAKGYKPGNWKGIPAESHLNHALNHMAKHRLGDTTEDHLGHFLWRVAAYAWAEMQATWTITCPAGLEVVEAVPPACGRPGEVPTAVGENPAAALAMLVKLNKEFQ